MLLAIAIVIPGITVPSVMIVCVILLLVLLVLLVYGRSRKERDINSSSLRQPLVVK